MRDRFVLRCQNFFLELLDVRCVVRVLLCAHFVEHDAERPDIRRFRLVLVLPELWRQIIRRTDFLNFFIIPLDALLHCLLSNPLERLASAGLPGTTRTDLLDIPEIAKFCRIVLCQENIERLDIPMDHVPGVQVVHAQANMDEDFPEKVVSERFAILFLDGTTEIAMLTVLHTNANRISFRDKAIVIADYKVRINLRHDGYFLHGVELFFCRQSFQINLFYDISLFSEKLSSFI